jgi:hypothetical protein
MGDIRASQQNLPLPGVYQPGDGAKRGALAGAVRADQGHDLAFIDLDRDPSQGLDMAIEAVNIMKGQ